MGVRAAAVSDSGVMMFTAGIELADGKSKREGAMTGLAGPLAEEDPMEPVVARPVDPVSATGWPIRESCSAQLAEYRAT